jgi:hypothetical protein
MMLIFITPRFSLITLCYDFAAAYYCFADAAAADAAPPLLLRRFSLIRHAILILFSHFAIAADISLPFRRHYYSLPCHYFDIRCHFAAITLSIFIFLRCH